MRRAFVLCAFVLIPVLSGCASSATTKLNCEGNAVSPSSQPGQSTHRKALDWYVHKYAKSNELPRSGYRLESHSKTRYIYVSGDVKVSVTALPTVKPADPKIWVVNQYFTC